MVRARAEEVEGGHRKLRYRESLCSASRRGRARLKVPRSGTDAQNGGCGALRSRPAAAVVGAVGGEGRGRYDYGMRVICTLLPPATSSLHSCTPMEVCRVCYFCP